MDQTIKMVPVYKNEKTGKYYTFDRLEDGATKFTPVYMRHTTYYFKPTKIDKRGMAYKFVEVVEVETKNGNKIYKAL